MECAAYADFCDFGTFPVVATVVVQLALHIAATIASWLLLCLLRNLCVCHIHMRTIYVQIMFAIVICNLYGIYEFLEVIYGVLVNSRSNAYTCASITHGSIPNGVLLVIGCFGFVLVVERVYATYNYLKYEDFNLEIFVQYICLFIWFFVIVTTFGKTAFSFIYATSADSMCPDSDPLKANISNLITALMYSIYCFLFVLLIKFNKEKRRHYQSYFSEGLGGRYQLMENISATQMLLPFSIGITVYCLGCFLFDWMRGPHVASVFRLIFKALFFPLFFIFYPVHIISSSSVLKRNATAVIRRWMYTSEASHSA
uniref:G_PROTEIN_RECEP_F1_2 domain-containing protein n=1 Tax=Steinernema glaseri TaxID=37863 RepID=A0A1I7Z0S8_9BILA